MVGGSGVQGHPQQHGEFRHSLGYLRPCLVSKPQNSSSDRYLSHCWYIQIRYLLLEVVGLIIDFFFLHNPPLRSFKIFLFLTHFLILLEL